MSRDQFRSLTHRHNVETTDAADCERAGYPEAQTLCKLAAKALREEARLLAPELRAEAAELRAAAQNLRDKAEARGNAPASRHLAEARLEQEALEALHMADLCEGYTEST